MSSRLQKAGGLALGVAIAGALSLWPLRANRKTQNTGQERTSAGEALFRASITRDPFGILEAQFFESDHGRKRWNIKSDFASLARKENFAFMKTVYAQFYAERTGNVVDTRSLYGKSYLDQHRIELSGDVSIESRQGYLFTMDNLTYDSKAHEFHTQDVVHMKGPVIKRPAMLLVGTGLDADIDDEHFFLRRDVTSRKLLTNGQWIDIRAGKGEFFTAEQRAVYSRNAKSQLPDLALSSERLEIQSGGAQESLLATGSVVLNRKDKTGHAESAFIEIGSNKIVLEGNASVLSEDNQIHGRKITLYTDDDRVDVEEASGRMVR